jgi:hypothetical protein
MFIYIVASAYTLHIVYWITKSVFRTLRILRGVNYVIGTALEITHTALELKNVVQHISASSTTNIETMFPEDINVLTSADILSATNEHIHQYEKLPSLTLEIPDESILNETYSDVSLSDTYSDLESNIIDEIAEEEDLFVEDEKRDGQYYLGHYFVSDLEEDAVFPLFLLVAIQSSTFLKYPYHFIEKYMDLYIPVPQKQIEIMKVHIRYDKQYRLVNVVLKTHWIRLIQRHWKKTYAQKKRVLIARMSPYSQMYYSFTGRYTVGYNHIPSLRGMMNMYSIPDVLAE